MKRLKRVLLVFVLVLTALVLFACKKKTNTWKTPGYVQGDFGNVPRLSPQGYGIMTPELKNSRELPNWDAQLSDGRRIGKKPIITTAYYETNDHNPLNALNYEIGDTGVPVIDIVVLFAFNFVKKEGTTKTPTVQLNPNNQMIVDNHEKVIKRLQEKGIRVVADFLPHHSGIGYANLDSDMIEALLDEIGELMDKYNLDGIDLDEEYAGYGKPGIPSSVYNSMSNFCRRFRERFPNKLLTVFNYGLPSDMNSLPTHMNHTDPAVGRTRIVDYAHNNYGSWGVPNYVDKIAASISTECNSHPSYLTMYNTAMQAINNGYGVRMLFNLQVHFSAEQMSGHTQALFGEDCKYAGEPFIHWEKGFHGMVWGD